MRKILIKEACIINEGEKQISDLLIVGERIDKIDRNISPKDADVIRANGSYLIPGMIDDQVHFREPGLTYKADLHSESRAAIAGGVTSFMEMPNTKPNTLSQKLLEEKFAIAAKKSLANFSFFMGVSKDNLEEVLKTDTESVCGISDDGLYIDNEESILANDPEFLEKVFSRTSTLIALHCEDLNTIKLNSKAFYEKYGDNVPFFYHSQIRSEEACNAATSRVLELAKRFKSRLHLLHISTLSEAKILENTIPIREKRVTAEVCLHHLWFSDKDYSDLGGKIKWNPSIKSELDKVGLMQSLLENHLDIVATDHAPHALHEKQGNYFRVKSGAPLVQHALPILFELYHQGKISLEKIVEKASHNVAEIYRIKDRGYIREGYFADLVIFDLYNPWRVTRENLLYKCKWSPFENYQFKSKIIKTFVNGNLAYHDGVINTTIPGKRLKFEKIR